MLPLEKLRNLLRPMKRFRKFTILCIFTFFLSSLAYSQSCNINSDSIVCLNETINFNIPGMPGNATVVWYFGDGSSSNQRVGSHSYGQTGPRWVKAEVSFANGSTCIDSVRIMVHNLPSAVFDIRDSVFCLNDQDIFVLDSSTPGTTTNTISSRYIVWGDGDLSQSSSPQFGDSIGRGPYAKAGTYIVTAEVINDKGCEDKWSKTFIIHDNYKPSFDWSFKPQTCEDRDLCLENDSSAIIPADVDAFKWTVGGSFADSVNWENPCFTITQPGDYYVRFEVTNQYGCIGYYDTVIPVDFKIYRLGDFAVDSINCYTNPFNVSRVNGSGGFYINIYNRPDSTLIQQNHIPGNAGASTQLNFGIGDYYIQMIIADSTCIDTSAIFSMSSVGVNAQFEALNKDQCIRRDTVYTKNTSIWHHRSKPVFLWDFEDPLADSCFDQAQNCNYDSSFHSRHWYDSNGCYKPFLYAVDTAFGCKSESSQELYLGAFTPQFSFTGNRFCVGNRDEYRISFRLTPECFEKYSVKALYDTCHQNWTTWNDPYKDAYIYPSTCDSTGFVTVSFTITRGDTVRYLAIGASDSIKESISPCSDTMTFPDWFQLKEFPEHEFSMYREDCYPADFSLILKVDSAAINHNITHANWGTRIDSGVVSDTGYFFSNTYLTQGTYKLSVFAEDTNRCIWTYEEVLRIGYNLDFEYDSFVCVNQKIVFDDQIYYIEDSTLYWRTGGAEKVWWDFGDSSDIVNGPVPEHSYAKEGDYEITMYTSDRNGCMDSITKTIHVGDVTAGIAHMDTSITCDQILRFLDSSTISKFLPEDDLHWYKWEFDDGSIPSELKNPYHYYGRMGKYTVKHIVRTKEGCIDTTEISIRLDGPFPEFNITTDSFGCAPLTVHFANNSAQTEDYIWHFGDPNKTTYYTDEDTSVMFTYDQPGVYYIYLEGSKVFFNEATQNYYTCKIAYPDTLAYPVFQKRVVVYPTPEVDFEYEDSVCAGSSIAFKSISHPIYSQFNWYINGAQHNEQTDSINLSFNEEGTYTVALYPLYIPNSQFRVLCLDSMEVEIDILDPQSQFSIQETEDCGEYLFVNESENDAKYTWQFGDGSSPVNTDSNESVFYSYGNDTGTFEVCLVATSGSCADTFCQDINWANAEAAYIYNVFTPNQDGLNDVYQIDMLGQDEYNIRIYNRWGELVFESSDPAVSWNGRVNNNGGELPSGSYFYILTYHLKCLDEDVESHGVVELIRE